MLSAFFFRWPSLRRPIYRHYQNTYTLLDKISADKIAEKFCPAKFFFRRNILSVEIQNTSNWYKTHVKTYFSCLLYELTWNRIDVLKPRRLDWYSNVHSIYGGLVSSSVSVVMSSRYFLGRTLHSFTLSTATAVTCEHCEGPSDYLGEHNTEF